jgi:hypothetical protein
MLGSITPLGERGRGRKWGRTVVALIAGGALGGAAVGLAAGAVGALVAAVVDLTPTASLVGVALLLAAACMVDALGVPYPSPHRQVNEDWLTLYRDWVYGLGFGVQLGTGVATVISSATVFAFIGVAALTGSPIGGLALGAVYGAVRLSTVLLGARVRAPGDGAVLYEWIDRLERPARRATPVLSGLLAAVAVAGVAL